MWSYLRSLNISSNSKKASTYLQREKGNRLSYTFEHKIFSFVAYFNSLHFVMQKQTPNGNAISFPKEKLHYRPESKELLHCNLEIEMKLLRYFRQWHFYQNPHYFPVGFLNTLKFTSFWAPMWHEIHESDLKFTFLSGRSQHGLFHLNLSDRNPINIFTLVKISTVWTYLANSLYWMRYL